FDHVGIEGSLSQELRVFDALSFILEHVDEDVADDSPFFLRIRDAGEGLQEPVAGIDDVQVGLKMIAESAANRFDFALSQQSVIHQNARQLRSDGPYEKSRSHR